MRSTLLKLTAFLILASMASCRKAVVPVPEKFSWRQYVSTAEAGFSQTSLAEAEGEFNRLHAGAMLVMVNGKVLLNQGDTNRRFFSASVRKSFLNSLIGIAVAREQMDMDSTLEELGIDDLQPLSQQEKTATLLDLITARSGVYHPAAFEDPGWAARRPDRSSHRPGEHWYYNNWDFNVLGHIYEQKTGQSIFAAFKEEIAGPLGMQDFRLQDGVYFEEPGVTQYPAYLFKMSARDMARFGLLYLNQGRWNGRYLVSPEWVERSLTPASTVFGDGTGFGYLWWHTRVEGHDVYYALGAGAQGIYLVPEIDLVVVIRSDPYSKQRISDDKLLHLLGMILKARQSSPTINPQLKDVHWPPRLPTAKPADPARLEQFAGLYHHSEFGQIELQVADGQAMLRFKGGIFRILWMDGEFIVEDIERSLNLYIDPLKSGVAEMVYDAHGDLTSVNLYRTR